MCDQQMLKQACTYTQSGQSLCQSLEYSMTVKLLTKHKLEYSSLKGGCTGSSESTLVKMPYCWKSHAMVHIISQCSLHHVTYAPTEFEITTSKGLGRDARTIKFSI